MPNSDLRDEVAKDVAEAIWQSKSIEVLDISGNSVFDAGCLVFVSILGTNTSINNIVLDGNGKSGGENRNKIDMTIRNRVGGIPSSL